MADDRTIRVRFLAEVNSYLDGVKKASTATANFGKQISGHGTAVKADMEKVGRAGLVLAGGLGLALGASAKAAMNWESAWAGVQKTVSGSADEMAQLEGELREMAKHLPATHKEIAAVAEAAGQLGVKRQDIAEFTKVMVDLGVSTNLTSDQAATSIAQMMNIMQTAPEDVDNLASTLVALGNAGASTESDILEMSKRLAGAGKLIGASESDVLALANAMSSVGIEAQLGGGAMSRAMTKIHSAVIDGGDDLEGFAKVANVSAKDFADKWRADPVAATDLFVKGLDRINKEGGNVKTTLDDLKLRGTQDRDVLLRLAGAGNLLAESQKLGNEEWERNIALQKEAERRYGTTESKMLMTKNKVNDLAIEMGDRLLPAISLVLDVVADMADAFGSLPGFVQGGVVAVAGLTFIASGVIGVVGTLAPKVKMLDTALQNMGVGTDVASRNLGRLGRTAFRVGGIFAAIQIGQVIDDAINPIKSGNIEKLQQALLDLADTGNVAGEAADILGSDFEKLGSAIESVASPSNATKAEHFLDSITFRDNQDDGLKQAKQRIDDLDKALADLAQTDPKAAASALEAVKDALGPEEFAELLPLLDDYEISLAGLDVAGRTAAGGIAEVTNAAGVSEKALDELKDSVDAIFNSLYGVEAASDQFQQGLNDLDDVMKQAVEDGLKVNNVLGDQSDGALALRGHMRDLANDAAAVIQEWVEQGTTGQELTDRVAGLSKAFEDQARAAGVPQAAIDHYLELLLAIPSNVPTTVKAETSEAEQKLRTIGILLGRIPAVAGVRVDASYAGPSYRRAQGGPISHLSGGGFPGGPSGTDTVPAWLTPGEYVVKAPTVRRLGLGTMAAINEGRLTAAAGGGSTTVLVQQHIVMTDANPRAMSKAVRDSAEIGARRGIR